MSLNIKLPLRLQTIANYVKPYRHVVDVGTDHCFVPIHLVNNGLIDSAIATDVNAGPLSEAKKNIIQNNLDEKIEVRLGNGLSPIQDNDRLDCIIVAGMGGKLISDILDTGKHIMHLNKRLILQPNVSEDLVRIWLCENHYEIVFEEILKEDGVIYEIIVAEKAKQNVLLPKCEILFGPILLKERNELFIEKWKNIYEHKKQIHSKIPEGHSNKQIILEEMKEIEKMLNSTY